MTSLNVDSDIEAQTDSGDSATVTESLHARITTPPTINTAIPQHPTTADGAISTNHQHNDLAVPRQTTQVQRGMLTCTLNKL